MMKQYWPAAIALDSDGKAISLFTYDSCLSVEATELMFKIWQDNYHYTLLCIWVQCNGEIINHRCLVNAIGQVKKI